ncbi:unnamed protein product [marine sediment metagenome]|uniref:Uncharacterized protein n=1 Tax=marine sediment metagenome TaxID=412755 RepID=X1P4G2_9ZZZZ
MISAEAKEITKIIYTRYGSDTGILFGIGSGLRSSVESIVQSVLEIMKEQKKNT